MPAMRMDSSAGQALALQTFFLPAARTGPAGPADYKAHVYVERGANVPMWALSL